MGQLELGQQLVELVTERMILQTALAALFVGAATASATVKAVRPVAPAFVAPARMAPAASLSPLLTTPAGLSATLTPSFSVPHDAPPAAPAAALLAPAAAKAPTPVEAVVEAANVPDALVRLIDLGVIETRDVPKGQTDRAALLGRVWDGIAEKSPSELLPVDREWAVPAIKVERGGKTYLVHGVAHGQYYPPNRRDVARLVSEIKSRGHELYSEQNLPVHYGYAYGKHVMDHETGESNGLPARVADISRGVFAGIPAVHALIRWAAVGGVGYSWLHATLNPSQPLFWLLAAGLTAGLWLLKRGLQPLNRIGELNDAAEAEKLGSPHIAEQRRRAAAAFYGPRVAPEDILRLHLPPGPGASVDPLSPRSAAIAAAAAASAAAVVHVLVGYRHAAEIAWRLAGKEGPRGGPTRE